MDFGLDLRASNPRTVWFYHSETLLFVKSCFSVRADLGIDFGFIFASFFDQFSDIFGYFFGIDLGIDFGMDFGWIWGSILEALGGHFAPSWAQVAPQIRQVAPQDRKFSWALPIFRGSWNRHVSKIVS